VVTQDFDSAWRQVSADIEHTLGGGKTETLYYDANWSLLSSTVVTVSGAVTTEQDYDASSHLLGGTISTALGPDTTLVQTLNSSWAGFAPDRLVVQAQSGLESFADTPGVATTFIFNPGDIAGDAFSGFVTAATNPSVHDVLEFVGYGAGAAISQVDASHWEVTAPGLATEVFTLSGALSVAAGDVKFV
jgi:hypothetical protein